MSNFIKITITLIFVVGSLISLNTSKEKNEDVLELQLNSKITTNQILSQIDPEPLVTDSLINSLIKESKDAPTENKEFLLDFTHYKLSSLKITQPLAAVFEGIDSIPFIFSNSYDTYVKESDNPGWREITPEDEILSKYDTITFDMNIFEERQKYFESEGKRKYYPQAAGELSDAQKTVFIFSNNNKIASKINSIGRKNATECNYQYSFYNFTPKIEEMLFSSKFNLELEFNNWKNIDTIINNNPKYKNYDCPNSMKKGRTFAKLKGFPSIYFVYAGSGDETYKSPTPFRSLVYIDSENNIYELWINSIDLFGCAC